MNPPSFLIYKATCAGIVLVLVFGYLAYRRISTGRWLA